MCGAVGAMRIREAVMMQQLRAIFMGALLFKPVTNLTQKVLVEKLFLMSVVCCWCS